jgi:hypothetical protein
MTDAEIIKVNECNTLAEGEKIKAIYPHIVVGGQIEKPCYSIQWYDIEKKTMLDGYASYKLEFVKKWLQENFEEIEFDIGDLINRQKAEIDELTEKLECLLCHATGSKLSKSTYSLRTMESAVNDEVQECCEEARAEAIKEFVERLNDKACHDMNDGEAIVYCCDIDNLVKEMVSDTK